MMARGPDREINTERRVSGETRLQKASEAC